VDSESNVCKFLKNWMDFPYNIKLSVNNLRATKSNSVFMHVIKTKSILQKSSQFFQKSYKNQIGFYGCYKTKLIFVAYKNLI